jgi:hypothetical protein
MTTDISDKPTTTDVNVLDAPSGSSDMVVVSQYTPRLDGLFDNFKEADMACAHWLAAILTKEFFGYEWKTEADLYQGVVAFSIPELMGATMKCAINLRRTVLSEKLVRDLAGELLERMGLPRGQVEMAMAVAARKRLHTFDFADVGKKRPA